MGFINLCVNLLNKLLCTTYTSVFIIYSILPSQRNLQLPLLQKKNDTAVNPLHTCQCSRCRLLAGFSGTGGNSTFRNEQHIANGTNQLMRHDNSSCASQHSA